MSVCCLRSPPRDARLGGTGLLASPIRRPRAESKLGPGLNQRLASSAGCSSLEIHRGQNVMPVAICSAVIRRGCAGMATRCSGPSRSRRAQPAHKAEPAAQRRASPRAERHIRAQVLPLAVSRPPAPSACANATRKPSATRGRSRPPANGRCGATRSACPGRCTGKPSSVTSQYWN